MTKTIGILLVKIAAPGKVTMGRAHSHHPLNTLPLQCLINIGTMSSAGGLVIIIRIITACEILIAIVMTERIMAISSNSSSSSKLHQRRLMA